MINAWWHRPPLSGRSEADIEKSIMVLKIVQMASHWWGLQRLLHNIIAKLHPTKLCICLEAFNTWYEHWDWFQRRLKIKISNAENGKSFLGKIKKAKKVKSKSKIKAKQSKSQANQAKKATFIIIYFQTSMGCALFSRCLMGPSAIFCLQIFVRIYVCAWFLWMVTASDGISLLIMKEIQTHVLLSICSSEGGLVLFFPLQGGDVVFNNGTYVAKSDAPRCRLQAKHMPNPPACRSFVPCQGWINRAVPTQFVAEPSRVMIACQSNTPLVADNLSGEDVSAGILMDKIPRLFCWRIGRIGCPFFFFFLLRFFWFRVHPRPISPGGASPFMAATSTTKPSPFHSQMWVWPAYKHLFRHTMICIGCNSTNAHGAVFLDTGAELHTNKLIWTKLGIQKSLK